MPAIVDWKPRFIAMLRETNNVRLSCRAANIDRRSCYRARDRSAEFARQWDEAIEDGLDVLEAKARQRAIEGSDYLLTFLLKAHRRDVYGDRVRQDIGNADGKPFQVDVTIREKAQRELDEWRKQQTERLSSTRSLPPTSATSPTRS